MGERSVYYWARNYADLKRGEEYDQFNRTVAINILGFNFIFKRMLRKIMLRQIGNVASVIDADLLSMGTGYDALNPCIIIFEAEVVAGCDSSSHRASHRDNQETGGRE